MPFLLVRHTVQDYAKWKPFFDGNADKRKANGSSSNQLFRNADNPNDLVILLEWDSLENARRFTQSQDLRDTIQHSGVIGQPEFVYLEEIERTSPKTQPEYASSR